MKERWYVVGDIHGAKKALEDCFERSGFNVDSDHLICLGDICDGWTEVKESIDFLNSVKNLILLKGNHDAWALQWMKTGFINDLWPNQGGYETMKSFGNSVPERYMNFLKEAKSYFIKDKKLFVHGGFKPNESIDSQGDDVLLWDRDLLEKARIIDTTNKKAKVTPYEEVFIGHTPTLRFNSTQPLKYAEIWMLDTGAGWRGGKLTIMDIESHEFWQSNPVESYYPEERGRG